MLAIAALEQGGFPQDVLVAKRKYVEDYAVTGSYWAQATADVRESTGTTLRQFLPELATHYHAAGQLAMTQAAPAGADSEAKGSEVKDSAAANYRLASEFYGQFVDSFPGDPREPEMQFMQAESLFEYGAVDAAISAYERVAYVFPDFPRAADAGYAAIASYALTEPAIQMPQSHRLWWQSRQQSELRFAVAFSEDARTGPVLMHIATEAFADADYQLATIAAATLLGDRDNAEQLVRARIIIADSAFNSSDFAESEREYAELSELLQRGDERSVQIRERWAASIYRQAEYALAEPNPAAAARQFERILDLIPDSSVATQAHYDAAMAWSAAADYERSVQLLESFRGLHTAHALSASISAKLVENYESMEQWGDAAGELDAMAMQEPELERQRQLQYLAATYYDKADAETIAIARYRSYAHTWVEPAAERFEAMNRLAELYAQAGETDKRAFWLGKTVASYDALTAGSERTLYLAAGAAGELASLQEQAYQNIRLAHPLEKTLPLKLKGMRATLNAWQKTLDYGVRDAATHANFRMGEAYLEMSQSLLQSERPAGLNELELEQYEILLEEQAFPLEEKAIAIHEANARRSWHGDYDDWVLASLQSLAELLPARYAKTEIQEAYSEYIF